MGEFTTQTQLTLSPHYYSAVNAITQPDRMVYCSAYLVEKWLPDLGGDGLAILLFLRRRCYHNRRTGELRNKIVVSLAEVARGCRLSVNTVRRQLQSNTALRVFVTSREEYVVEEKRGGVIQTGNAYTVSMDDPVHPADQAHLEAELRKRETDAIQEPQDAKQRARQQAQTQHQTSSFQREATPSRFGRALPHAAPSQNGRALRDEERTPILGDESNHYLALPKPTQTTTTDQRSKTEQDVVVSPATLEQALIAIGVKPKVACKLLVTHSEASIRQQLEWLPQRHCNDAAATLVESIKEGYGPPASAKKALPRPKSRPPSPPSLRPPVPNESDTEAMRIALAEARKKVRIVK